MTSVTHLASIPRRQPAAEIEQYSFNDVNELCAFVQSEIIASKRKFNKLAEMSGICASTLSKMAYGQTHQPRASTCLGILAALGWTIAVHR